MIRLLTLALASLLPLAAVHAQARPDHFKGTPAPTLEAALAHLATGHRELEGLLAKDALSLEDLARVHEITYTLENALERLGTEQARMAALLETVHQASERADARTVATQGRAYLEVAAPLTR